MSNKHVNLICQLDGLTPAQAFVLYRLADYADKDGQCFPGVPRIARETRLSERWVRLVLHELETRKLISRTNGTYATHFRTLYHLTYADLFSLEPVALEPDDAPRSNGHHDRALTPAPLTDEQIAARRAQLRDAMAKLHTHTDMEKGSKRHGQAKAPPL